MTVFSNELSYEVLENGYDIYLNGKKWMVQHEPNIPFPELSYEENAIKQCEELDETVNPEKILKAYKDSKITGLKSNLESFLLETSIVSSCHGADKRYSVSKEKQQLLAALIQKKEYAVENEIEFIALWNAKGEVAEEYELEELQQLSIEIYSYVQTYVTKQQQIESQINLAESKEAVDAIDINFA